MIVARGDIVLVDYPYSSGGGSKVRPVVVIQNDIDNQRLTNTIVAQITSITRRSLEPTQLLISIASPQGQATGLRQGRSPISIATGRGLFLEENFVGRPEAEARAGAVV